MITTRRCTLPLVAHSVNEAVCVKLLAQNSQTVASSIAVRGGRHEQGKSVSEVILGPRCLVEGTRTNCRAQRVMARGAPTPPLVLSSTPTQYVWTDLFLLRTAVQDSPLVQRTRRP